MTPSLIGPLVVHGQMLKGNPVSDVMVPSHILLFLWQGRRGWPGSPGTPGSRRKMVRALGGKELSDSWIPSL